MAVGNFNIDSGQILRQIYTMINLPNYGALNVEVVGTATAAVDPIIDPMLVLDNVYDEATNSLRVVIV